MFLIIKINIFRGDLSDISAKNVITGHDSTESAKYQRWEKHREKKARVSAHSAQSQTLESYSIILLGTYCSIMNALHGYDSRGSDILARGSDRRISTGPDDVSTLS